MENKKLLTEVLNLMKEFALVDRGSDEQIATKILEECKKILIGKIDHCERDQTSVNDWNIGYIYGLKKAIDIIDEELS